jgi:hypothetical protein
MATNATDPEKGAVDVSTTNTRRAAAIPFASLAPGDELDVTYRSTRGGEKTVRAYVLASDPLTPTTGFARAVRSDGRRIGLVNAGTNWSVTVECRGDGPQDARTVGYDPRVEPASEGRAPDSYQGRARQRADDEPMRLDCWTAGVVRVENQRYDDPVPEHVYSVRAERDAEGSAVATECSCPAFDRFEGPCKHMHAVERDGFVLDVAAPWGQ